MADTPRPFSYAIDGEARLAVGRMWGDVTGADMLALLEAVHQDPAWHDGFDALWDCSRVRVHIVAPDEVEPLVAEEADSGRGRDVLVESPTAGESALSQMLAVLCRRRGKSMTVHPTVAAALAALGHEAPSEAPSEAPQA